MKTKDKLSYFLVISGVVAGMGLAQQAGAQVQSAGELFVDIDATTAPSGPLNSIANAGTLGGAFSARGSAAEVPYAETVFGVQSINFDGNDFMQLVDGSDVLTLPPAGLVGPDPTRTVEVWAFNSAVAGEETLLSWGKRGGGDGSNMSFNYGNHPAFGAIGHWGGADIGWDDAGGAPAAGQWHHLVYTYDGTTTRVYSDGALANSETLGAGAINTHPDTSINLAAQLEPDGIAVTGGLRGSLAIAKVRIHDGVLDDAQVLNNYNFESATFAPLEGAPAASLPVNRYSFSEPPTSDANGQTLVDSLSGQDGQVLGEGSSSSGSRLVLPGGSSATQAYGDLPNGMVSRNSLSSGGSGEVTIEGWVKITGNWSWSRIFDIGSSDVGGGVGGEVIGPGGGGEGKDYFFLSAQVGGDTGNRQLDIRNEDPPGGVAGANVAFQSSAFGVDTHFVVTWDESAGRLKTYENGVEVAAMNVEADMSDINDVNVWLGRSNWTGDQNMQGEFDEFRVYDHVLSGGEVLGNFQAGPDQLPVVGEVIQIIAEPADQTVPEFGTAVFSVGLLGEPPFDLQWFVNGAEVPGANQTTFTIEGAEPGDNNSQVYVEASNNVDGVVTVTSRVATLMVNTDSEPPTLTQFRLASSLDSMEVGYSEAVLESDATDLANYTLLGPAGPVALASAVLVAPDRVVLTAEGDIPCGDLILSVSGVRDDSLGMNEIAPNSTLSYFHLIAGGVTHLYNFNNLQGGASDGSVVADLVGGADAVVLGANAQFSGDRVLLPGGGSGTEAYVDLPNGLVSGNSANNGGSGQWTFESWMKVSGNRNWARIFDFGSSEGGEVTGPGGGGQGLDYLALTAQIGGDTANRRFEIRNEDPAGGGIVTVDYSTGTFDSDVHVVVTWDEASGNIRAYENGVETGVIFTDDQMSDLNDVNMWLGRSNWTADQNLQGEFDEVRFYDRVLDAADVQNNFNAGIENDYGLVGFLNFTAAESTMQVNETQQMVVTVDFEKAFDFKMTGSPCITYESSDPGIASIDARGVVTGTGVGTVIISASFSGLNESLLLNIVTEPVSFTSQPADQTVDEFGTASFSVATRGTPPITYQWFINGTAVDGATSTELVLDNVSFADNNSEVYCEASNFTDVPVTVRSDSATLTVIADTVPPELTKLGLSTLSSVNVDFSEPILPADAMNAGLYTLTGPDGVVVLASAAPSSDPGRVILTAEGAIPCGPLTLSVTGVRDQSASGNEVAPGSTANYYHLIVGGMTHLYNFNNANGNADSGSVVLDVVGGADGVVLGSGAEFTNDRVSLPGGSSAAAGYVDLPNGLLSQNSANNGGSGEVTLEGWVKITGNWGWSRIFDIGSSDIGGGVGGEVIGPGGGGEGKDYLFLSAQVGGDTATRQLDLRNEDPPGGAAGAIAPFPSAAFGVDTHFAVTWNESTGELKSYENGVEVAAMTVAANMDDINDVNVWLGRSNWVNDQNMQGELDEFRIYNRVLSDGEVSTSFTAGLENNYGAPGFLNIAVDDLIMDVDTVQQVQSTVDFELAFDVNMTASPCIHYESSDTGVLTVDASGLITAVDGGSATVTVSFGGLAESVLITVLVPNLPPIANDDAANTDEDVAVVINVLANDEDPDGDDLTVSLTSDPANGSAVVNPDQTVTYTPAPNFNGSDSFTYMANDGMLDSNEATVTVTVNPVNDAPVCEDGSATTDEDVPVAITLAGSDVDGDELTFSIVDQPSQGSVSVSGNVATYTPAPNYCGADGFTFKVTDPAGAESGVCSVALTVNAVNDAPTAIVQVSPLSDLGPTVPGLILISPNNQNVCAVLDGSSSSDVDAENGCGNGDIVSYTWLVDGAEAGTGAVIDACLLVGAREVTLLVEDGDGAIGESTVIVEVLTGCEAVEELIMVVNDSVVERSNKRPFIATLKTACASFERGSDGAALNRLENAFMNKVNAQIGKDNPDVAAEWNRIAQEIVDAYLRDQDCEGCE